MPQFKTTYNILKTPWEDELFDSKWFEGNELVTPPRKEWDYKRELQIEDVSVWEVIFEGINNAFLYAAWDPYAEFYMLIKPDKQIETFYGSGAQARCRAAMEHWNIPYTLNDFWIDDDKIWLHKP